MFWLALTDGLLICPNCHRCPSTQAQAARQLGGMAIVDADSSKAGAALQTRPVPSLHDPHRHQDRDGVYPPRQQGSADWEDGGAEGSSRLPRLRPGLIASPCPLDKVSFDINSPSISGNVGGSLIVQRVLTGVCPGAEGPLHFTAVPSVDSGSAFSIDVWPSSVDLADGESATVLVTISALADTPMDTYQFGQVGLWLAAAGSCCAVDLEWV